MVARPAPHPNQRSIASLPIELRRTTVPPAVRAWITRATGSAVTGVRRLPGASSTAVHGVRLAEGHRLVLRRYVWPGFLNDEPLAPVREVDALRFAAARALPVPEVVAADVDGSDVGDGIPVLLMSNLAGRAVAVPDLRRLADVAAAIHDVDASAFGHGYAPWYRGTTVTAPPASSRPALWEAAIERWHTAMPADPATFIHRDLHPGNVLWSRGVATGVVDWANACRGPRGCDIAHCRANLVRLAGPEEADRFSAAYEAVTGVAHDPFWDLAATLEHGPSYWTPAQVAASEPVLARALF